MELNKEFTTPITREIIPDGIEGEVAIDLHKSNLAPLDGSLSVPERRRTKGEQYQTVFHLIQQRSINLFTTRRRVAEADDKR